MKTAAESANDVAVASKLFRGFGDRTRLAIIIELTHGERRVSELVATLNGTQGNISGHLRCLKDCGLLAARPSGREVFYRIAHPEVIDVLRSVTPVSTRSACSPSEQPPHKRGSLLASVATSSSA